MCGETTAQLAATGLDVIGEDEARCNAEAIQRGHHRLAMQREDLRESGRPGMRHGQYQGPAELCRVEVQRPAPGQPAHDLDALFLAVVAAHCDRGQFVRSRLGAGGVTGEAQRGAAAQKLRVQ